MCVCVCVCACVCSGFCCLLSQLGHVYIELLVGPRDTRRVPVWGLAFGFLYGFAKSAKLFKHNCMINLRLLAINFHSASYSGDMHLHIDEMHLRYDSIITRRPL